MKNYVEIQRYGVTEARFRANCRQALKNTILTGWMDTINRELGNIDGERNSRKFSEDHDYNEIHCEKLGEVQYYCIDREGHGYNFIFEFTYDDEKTGYGYFYCAEF